MRKPLTHEAIMQDIRRFGAATRSLSPDEYEELEQQFNVSEVIHKRDGALRNGRRVCRITERK